MNKNLITAIDWSGSRENPKDIYVLVSVEKKVYGKVKEYILDKLNPRHWRKFTKFEKGRYIEKFLRKWDELKMLITRCDIKYNFEDLFLNNKDIIERSKVLIIDDTVFRKYIADKNIIELKIILEKDVKEHYKPLIMLADSIANIFRQKIKEVKDIRKKLEIFERFRKI